MLLSSLEISMPGGFGNSHQREWVIECLVSDTMKNLIADLQDFYVLSFRGTVGLTKKPFYIKDTIEQMDYAGAGSFFIIVVVSLFVGMALSLQLSAELSALGFKMYTGKVMGISVIREIGPVTVALVFTGRVGSGITSELGLMVLGHQVDTLRVLGVDPVKKLVTPRILSSITMLPALTILGDAVALLGGSYISVFVSHQSGSLYWISIKEILNFQNVFSGVAKPFLFGYCIGCICCYMGLSTKGGALGLRSSTTKAVVTSIITIIIADFVLTRILLYVLGFTI